MHSIWKTYAAMVMWRTICYLRHNSFRKNGRVRGRMPPVYGSKSRSSRQQQSGLSASSPTSRKHGIRPISWARSFRVPESGNLHPGMAWPIGPSFSQMPVFCRTVRNRTLRISWTKQTGSMMRYRTAACVLCLDSCTVPGWRRRAGVRAHTRTDDPHWRGNTP